MCPGRHLALAEVRTHTAHGASLPAAVRPCASAGTSAFTSAHGQVRGLLLLLLQRWEIEVDDKGPPPPLDMTRAGLGILPPVRAVPCRIRRR